MLNVLETRKHTWYAIRLLLATCTITPLDGELTNFAIITDYGYVKITAMPQPEDSIGSPCADARVHCDS